MTISTEDLIKRIAIELKEFGGKELAQFWNTNFKIKHNRDNGKITYLGDSLFDCPYFVPQNTNSGKGFSHA